MNIPHQADPLEQLRDIHLPEAVGAWPPAPGWWILAALLLAALAATLLYWHRQRRRNHYRKLALKQLTQLKGDIDNSLLYLQALNQLLKQTALASPEPPPAAGLTGEQWLAFLDQTGGTTTFSKEEGQLLLEGPYTASDAGISSQQLQQLHTAAEHWIKTHQLDRAVTC